MKDRGVARIRWVELTFLVGADDTQGGPAPGAAFDPSETKLPTQPVTPTGEPLWV
jgi:hypothetical protein